MGKSGFLNPRGVRPLVLALAPLLAAAACGGPTAPSEPPPTIACPAPLTVPSLTGNPVAVTYPAPTVTGGSAPVATSCTPPSGSTFTVGSTPVSCTAQDSRQRVVACTFAVSVTPPPRLRATRFLAFGDSITEGLLEHPCRFAKPATLAEFFADLRSLPAAVDNPSSYPNILQGLLIDRYTAQSPVVTNEGKAAELVTEARSRLSSVLATYAPEVLLLQEGVNDVNAYAPSKGQSAIAGVVADMRTLVRDAQSRGVQVLVGTLLPQRVGGCRAFAPEFIAPANNEIRTMAAAEGADLVDLYEAFDGQLAALLGADGLHPSAAGYERMAQTFFDAIRQRLEAAPMALRDKARDPFVPGETVGERVGPTTFLPGKGIRLDTGQSYVRYHVVPRIDNGEFSMDVEGLRANAPGDKTKVLGMQDGQADFVTNRFRIDVQYRGTTGSPPNAIQWRAMFGSDKERESIPPAPITGGRPGVTVGLSRRPLGGAEMSRHRSPARPTGTSGSQIVRVRPRSAAHSVQLATHPELVA